MHDQLEFPWPEKGAAGGAAPKRAQLPVEPLLAEPPPLPALTLQVQADTLRATLTARSGLHIHLRITDNTSTMMSVRFEPTGTAARLSLHRMFLDAPDDIVRALAHWVKHPRGRKYAATLNGFIRERRDLIAPRVPRAVPLRVEGAVFNLQTIYDAVNRDHFDGAITAPITWGKMPTTRRRRSIRFGSYSPAEHLIRMHPLLDQTFVPEYFVRYIIFHEMLHAAMGIEELPSGRRAIHPPAFKKREQAYPEYARALAWMENPKNLKRLLQGRAAW